MRTPARGLGTATLVALVLLAVTSSPAHAFTSLSDSFENTATSSAEQRWTSSVSGSGWARIENNSARASSGSRYGWLRATGGGSFASLGRTVTMSSTTTRCSADVAINPESVQSDGRIRLNLEVIDPATWTYVSLRQHDIDVRFNDYQFFKFSPWVPAGPRKVFLRVSLLGYSTPRGVPFIMDAYIDDLAVLCT